MKIRNLRCPECGADLGSLEVKGERLFVFCPYCGSKVAFDTVEEEQAAKENIGKTRGGLRKTLSILAGIAVAAAGCLMLVMCRGAASILGMLMIPAAMVIIIAGFLKSDS